MAGFGHFEGEVVTKWLKDDGARDRTMELVEDFAYVDPQGKQWLAASGRLINGASIPASLWNTIGPPYVGNYRRATVLHDVACEDESEPSDDVHDMFFWAMRCDGVGLVRASSMHWAVKRYGPSWGPTRSMAMPRSATPSVVELDQIESAAEQAVLELGSDADLSTLEARIDELVR